MADLPQDPLVPAPSARPRSVYSDESKEATTSCSQRASKRQRTDMGSGRGNRRGGHGGCSQKRNMGRAEYNRSAVNKRTRHENKQQAIPPGTQANGEEKPPPIYATFYSKEEINAEPRKPKNKVAVMVGYSGSGYRGMQLNDTQKTIEGDLFGAFVRAGAISKSNADDPKKSSLVRCARTDKGVHAAGNIVSLKLITEDTDIVQKINRELCPQIRVFGISRVNGGFSAYQLCDSRIYEYLIPTYCFLPPHPDSFLARKLLELAGEAGDLEGYQLRQEEVSNFWSQVEKDHINPILERADPNFLPVIRKALYQIPDKPEAEERVATTTNALLEQEVLDSSESQHILPKIPETAEPVIKELKSAYLLAKKAYRISQARRSRILATLNSFIGTHNFHNYTVNKTPRDPSASRVIKSMTLDDDSKIIEGTEWLSIKIHGQSFMMHQIRKMISTVAMIVRCGAEPQRVISLTFSRERVSIPKAPGLGLLLERPVFDAYNEKKLVGEFGREPVGFTKYEVEMQEFKQNEIYDRIWREEAEGAIFHGYFSSVDNLHSSQLLYLSSMGVDALSRAENSEKQARSVDDAVAEATGLDDGSEGMPDEPDG